VLTDDADTSRFNGFNAQEKPLKRLGYSRAADTRLKPGANESGAP
jgi:hypothetical protein